MKRLVMCINSSCETVLLERLSIIVKVNFYGGFLNTLSENCTRNMFHLFCKEERQCFGERKISAAKLESRRETGYS